MIITALLIQYDNSNNYTCGFDSYTGPTTKTLTDTKTVTGYIKDPSGNTNSCSKKFTRTSTTQTRYRSCAVSKCALYGGYSSSTSYVTSCSADGTKGAGSSYTTCSSQTIYRTYCTPKCVLNGMPSVTTKTGTTQYGSWQGYSPSKTTCSMTCSSGSSFTYTNGIESKSGYKKNSYSGGYCTSYSCSTWGTYGSWSTNSCTSANPASTSSGLKDCQTQTVYSWS